MSFLSGFLFHLGKAAAYFVLTVAVLGVIGGLHLLDKLLWWRQQRLWAHQNNRKKDN